MAEYIDRTALGIGYADPKAFINPAHADGWNTAIQIINEAPAADVAPVVHGYWEMKPEDTTPGIYHVKKAFCSNCGKPNKQYRPPFCPHCGAKMDEVSSDE